MRHENLGTVHTHTHTCINLIEEKRVDIIYSKNLVLKNKNFDTIHTCISLEKRVESNYINFLKVLMVLVCIQILTIISNLIDRLLFSKQNYLLPKSNFLFFKKIQLRLKKFLKKMNIRKCVFKEITISRLNQFVC